MADPVEWLTARLDEIETRAKAAEEKAPSPWLSYEDQGIVEHSGPEETSYMNFERGNQLWDTEGCREGWRRLCMDEAVAAHVAGMYPAMVLQLAAATREVINLHFPNFRYVPMTKDRWLHLQGAEAVAMASRPDEVWKGDLTCDVCGEEYGLGENPRAEWPCDTVKALATGWGWTDE